MQNENKKGFTLIELLIVVVIIGILAAIAIPKFAQTREKAYVSAMKSDLRNLATEQEIYYSDAFEYGNATQVGFNASDRVTVTVGTSNSTSWDATAAHAGTAITCAITYTPLTAGQVTCST
jgi:prepilin-type N-terminal cleavage/methylation domain-containing protein